MKKILLLAVSLFLLSCSNDEPKFIEWNVMVEVIYEDNSNDTITTNVELDNKSIPVISIVTSKTGFLTDISLTPCIVITGSHNLFYKKVVACYVKRFNIISIEKRINY